MKDIISLRAHHTLCSQFFIGNGYSEEFVENMKNILALLNSSNPMVKIVEHCDDICEHCPKRKGNTCENEKDVCVIDQKCMDEYSFKIGDEIHWNDIKADVVGKIISKNCLPNVCNDCSWLYICKNIDINTL